MITKTFVKRPRKVKLPAKKWIYFVVQLSLVAAIFFSTTAGTMSYEFVASPSIVNDFTIGSAQVNINEPGVDPNAVQWGGSNKKVTVSIPDGKAEGVVRVLVVPVLKTLTGEIIGQSMLGSLSEPVSNKIVMGDITLNFDPNWQNEWLYMDGYFYYRRVLQPGETAQHLLTGVTLTNPTPAKLADYQNIRVEIEVTADVIQAIGGAPSVWGLTVNADDTVVKS